MYSVGNMNIILKPVEGPAIDDVAFENSDNHITIGREADSDVRLDSEFVSRKHAILRCENKRWFITDLGSQDGVFVNTIQIKTDEPFEFFDDDLIAIGPWTFQVSGTGAAFQLDEESLAYLEEHTGSTSTNASMIIALKSEDVSKREKAWKSFVERYKGLIFKVGLSFQMSSSDIDDIVQEVLIALMKSEEFVYDPGKGKFRSYLKKATRTTIFKHWRAKQRNKTTAIEEVVDDQFDRVWNLRWREYALQKALESIQRAVDPTHFEAFELCGRRGVPARKVAEQLGISEELVRQAKLRVTTLVRAEIARLERNYDRE